MTQALIEKLQAHRRLKPNPWDYPMHCFGDDQFAHDMHNWEQTEKLLLNAIRQTEPQGDNNAKP